jgi:MSHA biogenesis protein MshP
MMGTFRSRRGTRRTSSGMGMVTAIFLLVVLAGLGVAIVSVVTTQQATSTQDQQGARAYQAARAGIEWALYIGLQTNLVAGNPATPGTTLACPRAQAGGITFSMPQPAAIAGVSPVSTLAAFSVTVTCDAPTVFNGIQHVMLRATACNEPNGGCPNTTNPSADYVQRVVEVQL